MKLFLALIISGFISTAHSLKCNNCTIPRAGDSCVGVAVTCQPAQTKCRSSSEITIVAGAKSEKSVQSCAVPAECVSGSYNFGISSRVYSSKCCDGNMCNREKAPAISNKSPNGRKCSTCVGGDCTKTIDCSGDEDYCADASVFLSGYTVTMMGCTSKSICSAGSVLTLSTNASSLRCCEGNLCNSGRHVTHALLLFLIPAASAIL